MNLIYQYMIDATRQAISLSMKGYACIIETDGRYYVLDTEPEPGQKLVAEYSGGHYINRLFNVYCD